MLEQIYNDFVIKFLPKISEGLTITKDYFFDLFGRYVKFLIFWDSVGVAVGLLLLISFGVLVKKTLPWLRSCDEDVESGGIVEAVVILLFLALLIIGFLFFFINLYSLAQDIFVPEIRVYQKLIPLIKQ